MSKNAIWDALGTQKGPALLREGGADGGPDVAERKPYDEGDGAVTHLAPLLLSIIFVGASCWNVIMKV